MSHNHDRCFGGSPYDERTYENDRLKAESIRRVHDHIRKKESKLSNHTKNFVDLECPGCRRLSPPKDIDPVIVGKQVRDHLLYQKDSATRELLEARVEYHRLNISYNVLDALMAQHCKNETQKHVVGRMLKEMAENIFALDHRIATLIAFDVLCTKALGE
ncbi:MAG: hypothetical protein AAB343_02815 [Patescibacteria group bacterium]